MNHINLEFLRSVTKDNTAKMHKYINMYLILVPDILEQMKLDLNNKDYKSLKIKAHSLKPQVDYMGIKNLKEHLVNIEEGVQHKRFKNLSIDFQNVVDLYEISRLELQSYLDTQQANH